MRYTRYLFLHTSLSPPPISFLRIFSFHFSLTFNLFMFHLSLSCVRLLARANAKCTLSQVKYKIKRRIMLWRGEEEQTMLKSISVGSWLTFLFFLYSPFLFFIRWMVRKGGEQGEWRWCGIVKVKVIFFSISLRSSSFCSPLLLCVFVAISGLVIRHRVLSCLSDGKNWRGVVISRRLKNRGGSRPIDIANFFLNLKAQRRTQFLRWLNTVNVKSLMKHKLQAKRRKLSII